jgi:glutathione S-transferase
MKLFYNGPSPYGRKVIVAAHEFGLAESMELRPFDPWKHSEEVLRLIPGGKVPALLTDDGLLITESTTICEYFRLLATGPFVFDAAFADVMARTATAQGIIDAGYISVIEGRRPAEKRWDDWIVRQRSALDRLLKVAQIKQDRFDIGDMSLACGLAYLDFRLPQLPWRAGNPALASWLDHVSQRPSMQKTKPQ